MTRIVRAFCATLALCLALVTPASADLLLLDVGGFGALGIPASITISSQVWTSISDITTNGGGATNYVQTDGWTADVAFSGLGSYSNGATAPAPVCDMNAGFCTDAAFSVGGVVPSTLAGLATTPAWSSQTGFPSAFTIPVTRPGYSAAGVPTTVSDAVNVVSYLRTTAPPSGGAPTPFITVSGGKPTLPMVLNKTVYANDAASAAVFPANLYWDGAQNNAINVSVPVSNSSTAAYPAVIGNWLTEPGITYDGTGSATVEFVGGHGLAYGAQPLAGVTIIMGDNAGHSVSQTATLQQSTRIPSTGCTATNGSNILTNCGNLSWAQVGQRLNVVSTQRGTAVASGAISAGATTFAITGATSSPVAGQSVFSATAQAQIGTVASYSAGVVTLSNAGGALNASAGASDALVFSGGAVRGEPIIGAIDLTATANCPAGSVPCIELFVQQNATFNANGSLSISMATAAVGGGNLPQGQALADGLFLGGQIVEVGGGGLWAAATQTMVAPVLNCGVSGCGLTGTPSTTGTLTVGAGVVTQGQLLLGGYLYDNASSPCIPTDISYFNSTFISALGTGTGGVGTYTLQYGATGTSCSGHTLTGLGIAAQPNATKTTTISISTSAASATAGTDTVQFNQQFVGASGAVTVTAGAPVPVYSATFPASNFSALTQGPIHFRVKGYPSIGDQVLDSNSPLTLGADIFATANWSAGDTAISIKNCSGVAFTSQLAIEVVDVTSGLNVGVANQCIGMTLYLASPAANGGSSGDMLAVGQNVDCDWWFPDYQSAGNGYLASGASNGVVQSCSPNSAAWVGAGVANAQKVTANLHNLWAYYDKAATQSFAWRYAWVNASGTAGTAASAIQTGSADPGSNASYFSTLANAVTAAKAYNNSTTNRAAAHNDPDGVVFCLMPTGSPWTGGATFAHTTLTPGPVLTSAPAGGTCPAPGQYAPIVAQMSAATFTVLKIQNLNIVENSGSTLLGNGNGSGAASFPSGYLVLDHVSVSSTAATGAAISNTGEIYTYDSVISEGVYPAGLSKPVSAHNAVVAGSTINCGAYNAGASGGPGYAPNVALYANNAYGNVTWLCIPGGGTSTFPPSIMPWSNSQVWAYNKFMGMPGAAAPVGTATYAQNALLTHNIFEGINNRNTNQQCLELSGDSYISPAINFVVQNNTCLGGRTNMNYIEGFGLVPTYLASSGLIPTGSYYIQAAYSRANNSNVVSSTDSYTVALTNSYSPYAATVAAANAAYRFNAPCDFNELFTVYMDQSSNMKVGGVIASFVPTSGTATGASPTGAGLTLSAAPSTTDAAVTPGMNNVAPAATFLSADGSTILLDTTGKPLLVSTCPGGVCTVAGAYTLSGTPAVGLTVGTKYYLVEAQLTHLADVASFSTGSTSGATLTLTSAPTGNLYVGATLATASGVIATSGGAPVRIQSCPNGGCNVAGSYVLTGAPAAALVSGTTYVAQATGLSMCQNITIIAVDTVPAASEPYNWLPAPIASGSFPARNYFKAPWAFRSNVWTDMNMKADYYITFINGGRVGNWPVRFGVDHRDDVYVTSPYGNPCFMYSALCGEIRPANTWYYSTVNALIYGDMSAVRFITGDDRSCGGCDASHPPSESYPGLNIGMGHYCPTTSNILPTTNATIANGARMAGTAANPRVPAGDAQWPFDVAGNPHFAALPGWSGAFEMGCQ